MVEYDLEDDLDTKLKHYFDGKIVRKDLTKRVKEGANVPVYVLEYLLGKYCSQDDALVEQGVQTVKDILANNYYIYSLGCSPAGRGSPRHSAKTPSYCWLCPR